MKRGKLYSILTLACLPLLTGCQPAAVAATAFGAVFWADLALIPVRSFLGATALNIINTI